MTAIHRPLDRSFRRLVRAVSLAIGLGLAAAVPASAQETGENIVLQAVEAAKKLESLTAKVKLTGAGGFKDFVPTADGTIHLLKVEPNEEGLAWTSRVDADYIHKKGEEQQQITAVRSPLVLAYIDHDKKSVEERGRNSNRTVHSSVIDLLAIPELTAAEPYRRELREGEAWTNAGRETVNGVECDVVEIRYDMTKGSDRNANQIIRTPGAKWYFGVEDRIPRRVERITDEGMISFTIVLDLTDVEINPGIEPEAMEIETPEGYSRTISSKRTTKDGVEKIASPGPTRAPAVDAEPGAIDPTQVKLPAHGFELVDADGNEVSLESLKGNVAVLYFWGTWCVPCKQFSPLVSDLVATFEGEPVKVFGLPVRERDESAVRAAMDKYNHTLLLDPSDRAIGCDVTAGPTKSAATQPSTSSGPRARSSASATPRRAWTPSTSWPTSRTPSASISRR
jgi:thiol-disulfide isomerase/thioredoxin